MTTVEEKSIFAKWVEDNCFIDWYEESPDDMEEALKRMTAELEKMFTTLETIAYEKGRRFAEKKFREEEGAWLDLHKQAVLKLAKEST